jgi:hypothetical protein
MRILVLFVVSVGCLLLGGCGGADRTAPTPADEDRSLAAKPSDSASTPPAPAEPADEPPPLLAPPAGAVELESLAWTRAGLRFRVPKSWIPQPPRSQYLEAEFTLPRAKGDAQDGRLTITSVSSAVEDGVALWRKQFGDRPEKESRQRRRIGDIPVTLIDYTGTYRDQASAEAPLVESPGFRMLGAILEMRPKARFIKAYGPAKTIAAHADGFSAMLGAIKPAWRDEEP